MGPCPMGSCCRTQRSPKESKGIQRNPKRAQRNPKESKGTQWSLKNPRNPKVPQGTQRNPKEAKGTQRNPKEPKGTQKNPKEPKGTQRYPKKPKGNPNNHDQFEMTSSPSLPGKKRIIDLPLSTPAGKNITLLHILLYIPNDPLFQFAMVLGCCYIHQILLRCLQ